MKTVRYTCTHCGRRFEAEEKEIIECPGCFWTTSVKRAEDVAETSGAAPGISKKSFQLPSFQSFKLPLILLLVSGLGFFLFKSGVPFLKKTAAKSAESAKASKEEKKKGEEKNASVSAAPVASPAALSPQDQEILKKRVQVTAEREPTDEEQKILSARAQFKTGFSEQLPSQAWTLQNFKDMISQQEKFYKITLPRSYRNKLTTHFEQNYLPGAEAFKAGELLRARDLWVASLGVPLYSTNIQKHRGVVLTMIRPFITDTLSKIGAINSAAVEKEIRNREQAVLDSYSRMLAHIEKKAWPEALAVSNEVNQQVLALGDPKKLASSPAPYPPSIAQVDQDIQYALNGMLTVSPPAVSDFEPVIQDLYAKSKVAESFIPEALKKRVEAYQDACAKIDAQDWKAAEAKLKEVDLPLELMRDASDKIRVLKKIQK